MDSDQYAAIEVIEGGREAEPWPSVAAFFADEVTELEAPRTALGLVADRYHLLQLLSEGGMGRVYRARHRELGREFALKLVLDGLERDPSIRERFFREARLASSLNHRNIISVTDFGCDEAHGYFLVMELLEGETLRQRLDRARASVRFACDVMDQVAGAVRYMHAQRVVHCDLKPENIFLTRVAGERRQNVVKLLDFGLSAKREGSPEKKIGGTPPYLAPERLRGEPATARCDVYSLGMVMYELLTGALPYDGDEHAVIEQQLGGPPPPAPSLRAREPLDARADALVLRALARDPAARQPSAEAFHYELRALMEMTGIRARRTTVTQTLDPAALRGGAGAESFEVTMMRSPVPLAVVEPSGALRFANAAFLTLSEGAPTKAPAHFDQLRFSRKLPELKLVLRQVLDGGKPAWRLVVAKNGQPMLLMLAPSLRGGRVENIHVTLLDPAMGGGR